MLEDGKYLFLGECEVSCKNTKKYRNSPKVHIAQAYATINKPHNATNVFLTISSNLILYPYLYFISDSPESNVEWEFLDIKENEDESSKVCVFSYKCMKGKKVAEEGRFKTNASVDPFKVAKEIKIVDISELKHLNPDYELEHIE